jgi:hypothetical protein
MITLKTLEQATAQEVFDQVATHLLTQNKKSAEMISVEIAGCRYRSSDGLKCAAGCLIGDDEYSREMETRSWRYLIHINLVPDKHSDLICRLQKIHDDVAVAAWREKLLKLQTNVHLLL